MKEYTLKEEMNLKIDSNNLDVKPLWDFKINTVSLPDRREIKPVGRITLLGKKLTAKQTKNYIKAL
jgi:hypothetical protein